MLYMCFVVFFCFGSFSVFASVCVLVYYLFAFITYFVCFVIVFCFYAPFNAVFFDFIIC